ncbi:hypothetical protein [Clostridium sp. ZBS18]|uniref:hypothetical protein n=1 Tax=Clostridium sp. ZBS18 TaxID=2949967 RepID=UPI00207A6C19|nr:hypothetical protein [Clostridium sp. ZBS18]
MTIDEKVELYLKTVISWGRVKDRSFELSDREKELLEEAYLSGYEDGQNEKRN